jgi:hypothetical protein
MKPRPDEFKPNKKINKTQQSKMDKIKNYIKQLKEKFKVKCTVHFD